MEIKNSFTLRDVSEELTAPQKLFLSAIDSLLSRSLYSSEKFLLVIRILPSNVNTTKRRK